jgi:two-component system sensor histidine kinase PilS (NtrC family)
MAIFSALLLVVSAVLSVSGIVENFGPDQTLSKVTQYVSFNVVAILIVGMLAARLSERRHSGEKLVETTKTLASLRALHERIIESIRSGLITTDLEGRIFTFNSAAAEITGRTADEMKGKHIAELFPDAVNAIDAALTGVHEQPTRFETDLKTPDGFAVHIGYSIAPLFSEEKEASGLIVTFQDLTEIRSMEESVRRKDRLAAVGRVAAGLAHEIRNPLGAMRGAIQVLDSNMPPDSVQANLMEIILKESDRLNKIITNFLSYARPKVGEVAELDISEAIRETFTLLSHSPDLREDHILNSDLPTGSVFVHADGSQLKQVFWNLSRNAIQAMPDGGTLTVSLENMPDDRIRIVFRDTGRGMPQRQVEQLFEPFSTSTTGGTGLGLSIVYQIIRDHNGTINVTSREGEGTAIAMIIPRGQPAAASNQPEKPDATDAAETPLSGLLKVKSRDS